MTPPTLLNQSLTQPPDRILLENISNDPDEWVIPIDDDLWWGGFVLAPHCDYAVNVVSCSHANEVVDAKIVNAAPVEQDTWWSGFVIAPCCRL